jgi:hypothetical protein
VADDARVCSLYGDSNKGLKDSVNVKGGKYGKEHYRCFTEFDLGEGGILT